MHYLADLPTHGRGFDGLMLFYPLSHRRFTLRAWEETGYGSLRSTLGFYTQKNALLAELSVSAIALYLVGSEWVSYAFYTAVSGTLIPIPTPPIIGYMGPNTTGYWSDSSGGSVRPSRSRLTTMS